MEAVESRWRAERLVLSIQQMGANDQGHIEGIVGRQSTKVFSLMFTVSHLTVKMRNMLSLARLSKSKLQIQLVKVLKPCSSALFPFAPKLVRNGLAASGVKSIKSTSAERSRPSHGLRSALGTSTITSAHGSTSTRLVSSRIARGVRQQPPQLHGSSRRIKWSPSRTLSKLERLNEA